MLHANPAGAVFAHRMTYQPSARPFGNGPVVGADVSDHVGRDVVFEISRRSGTRIHRPVVYRLRVGHPRSFPERPARGLLRLSAVREFHASTVSAPMEYPCSAQQRQPDGNYRSAKETRLHRRQPPGAPGYCGGFS